MNDYDRKLKETGQYPLKVDRVDTFVVNFGLVKNPLSMHYYAETAPEKMHDMPLDDVDKVLRILEANSGISLVEITGTSPEIHPGFQSFVQSASEMGKKLAVVSNPAVYAEPGMDGMPEFLAGHRVKILAFVPHYDENEVDNMMGRGTFHKIVSAFRKLNRVGYSREGSGLTTAMVYLPARPEIAADRDALADAYRRVYRDAYGIKFNHFIVFNTVPIGRFNHKSYMNALKSGFNPETLAHLPCRHALSIGPDGMLYDCDFMVAAGRPVRCSGGHLDSFDYASVIDREVATSEKCFICTEGRGATCADCFT